MLFAQILKHLPSRQVLLADLHPVAAWINLCTRQHQAVQKLLIRMAKGHHYHQ